MPLEIKPKVSIPVAADKLIGTDITGAYTETTNEGGYGAPNVELNAVALWMLPVLKHSTGDKLLLPVTNYAVYDPTALNTKETSLEFVYLYDGVIHFHMGILPVSLDGVNYLDLTAIADDDYFYYPFNGTYIWQRIAGVNTPVLNLLELIENEATIEQAVCEDLFFAELVIERQKLAKQYRIQRDKKCDDAIDLKNKMRALSDDLQGAYYAFACSLQVEAQSQIEELNRSYDLE